MTNPPGNNSQIPAELEQRNITIDCVVFDGDKNRVFTEWYYITYDSEGLSQRFPIRRLSIFTKIFLEGDPRPTFGHYLDRLILDEYVASLEDVTIVCGSFPVYNHLTFERYREYSLLFTLLYLHLAQIHDARRSFSKGIKSRD